MHCYVKKDWFVSKGSEAFVVLLEFYMLTKSGKHDKMIFQFHVMYRYNPTNSEGTVHKMKIIKSDKPRGNAPYGHDGIVSTDHDLESTSNWLQEVTKSIEKSRQKDKFFKLSETEEIEFPPEIKEILSP